MRGEELEEGPVSDDDSFGGRARVKAAGNGTRDQSE
jgi:hypothetical protein